MDPYKIARICHELNMNYCRAIGDFSQLPWEYAPDWQKESAIKGVTFIATNPDSSPSASHDSWLNEKKDTGWKYGPVKDAEKKEHPCFVPYEELPLEQRLKDELFSQTVKTLLKLGTSI